MDRTVPLSSKLAVTAEQGFALRQSRQPHYRFDWHMHDCAMLLWPQLGALDSRWVAEPGAAPQALQLVRHTALLLPASAAHSTRSRALRQRHGELYLRPELLGRATRFGVVRLDGAAFAMLEALASPTLAPRVGEPLVHALVAQLTARGELPGQEVSTRAQDGLLSQRMLDRYADALDEETGMPTVEAVAEVLGVSARQLQRACAIELGTSPVAIRRRLLAARARELLARGVPPSLVSQQLCFTHSGHLTRLLREVPA
ncbi:helix-turn-helix domain-containing protein [Xylophilus rhododendri]|uniref:Helix-turn-helix domain-containing protein n=1 Tax=Xylophilus rhododendri TaxID=2697032 RepID=A0A857J6K3_9BURK|nr:helix-turn-helix domain-containing protein [Xylophilus rhododendri]QHI98445.1 helix-turn-helix domain-containing protein [Xylophilus rhododendri]